MRVDFNYRRDQGGKKTARNRGRDLGGSCLGGIELLRHPLHEAQLLGGRLVLHRLLLFAELFQRLWDEIRYSSHRCDHCVPKNKRKKKERNKICGSTPITASSTTVPFSLSLFCRRWCPVFFKLI